MDESPLPAKPASGQPRARSYAAALAALFAVVAIVAAAAAVYVWRGQQSALAKLAAAQAQASQATQSLKAGKDAIDTIITDLAGSLGNRAGLQPAGIVPILGKVAGAVDKLQTKTADNPDVERSRGSMYIQFSTTYLALGDTKLAVAAARKGTDIYRALAAAEPNNNLVQSDVGLSLEKLAAALHASGDNNGAITADRESLQIARALAAKEPGNRQFRTDVVLALWRLAAAGDDPRERLTEALSLLKNLKLAAMLTPDQERWIAMIESDLSKLQ
jgi:hypothetical protein